MIINLSKKLEKWVSSGIITPSQMQQIITLEKEEPSRPWVIYGVAAIGVTAILTGIVSLIAANWDFIPGSVKLLVYFAVQAGVGAVVWKTDQDGKSVWREMSLFAFALLFLGGIGLVAQVFNLHSAEWKGYAFWLFIILPITLKARSFLLHHIWVGMTLVTTMIWSTSGGWYHQDAWLAFCLSVIVSVPVALTALGFLLTRVCDEGGKHFQVAALVWGLGSFLLLASIAGNIMWVEKKNAFMSHFPEHLILPWVLIVSAVIANYIRPRATPSQRLSMLLLLTFSGIYLTIPSLWSTRALSGTSRDLLAATGFIIIWSFAASSAAFANYRRLFDFASFIIAIRFIVIYFEVFGNLTTTGFGLILSGSFILFVVWIWYRYRVKIQQLVSGGRHD